MNHRKRTLKRKKEQAKDCPSGKVPYETQEGADFYARADAELYAERRKSYRCPHCSKWHLATVKRRLPMQEPNENQTQDHTP